MSPPATCALLAIVIPDKCVQTGANLAFSSLRPKMSTRFSSQILCVHMVSPYFFGV